MRPLKVGSRVAVWNPRHAVERCRVVGSGIQASAIDKGLAGLGLFRVYGLGFGV